MNVAFIPVRGGSKSIPLKNIKEIAGRPLVYWTVKAANECKYIDKVYVATDSDIIKKTVETFSFDKVRVIGRSAQSASDTASTESAMLEFAEQYEFDNIYLIQATSPLLTAQDLNGGFELFESDNTESVLSVVRQKRFHWELDETGNARPTNYDVFNRPRRQEFDGYLVENGAFYITSKNALLSSQNRVSGNIKAYEMDEVAYFEIDEPSDWIIIEGLLKNRIERDEEKSPLELKERLAKIKLFLTDCDGCLTDGGMYYSENGDELKKFNTKDGAGIAKLRERGIKVGIITGENMELNKRRAEKLHIDEVFQGVSDKAEVLRNLASKYNLTLDEVAYMGDDLNDLECIKLAGVGFCPSNATEEVKAVADYVTDRAGGDGAVREACNIMLS